MKLKKGMLVRFMKKGMLVRFVKATEPVTETHPLNDLVPGDIGMVTKTTANAKAAYSVYWQRRGLEINVYPAEVEVIQ